MKHTIHKTVSLNLDGFKGEPVALISLFRDKAQKQGWSKDETEPARFVNSYLSNRNYHKQIESVVTKVMRLMDYHHLIETIKKHCKN